MTPAQIKLIKEIRIIRDEIESSNAQDFISAKIKEILALAQVVPPMALDPEIGIRQTDLEGKQRVMNSLDRFIPSLEDLSLNPDSAHFQISSSILMLMLVFGTVEQIKKILEN